MDESHEGLYSCTPYNILGTEGASPPVRVRVQKPPTIIRRPQTLYLTRLGQQVHMPCVASDGNIEVPPVIVWSRVNYINSLVIINFHDLLTLLRIESYSLNFFPISQKDGLELPEGRHSFDGGNMTIDDVTEEDRGVYVCTARNDAASVDVETELMIENVPPRAPYNLTAVATHETIHVSWVPGRYI